MKKFLSSFLGGCVLFFSATVFAQMPVPVSGTIPLNLEKIGVVAAAQGKVELTTPGQIGRVAQSGQPIFMGDEVKTDSQGHLQILLLDQTVFTIGPNSAIVIDQFVYDPKTQDGQIRASITKGVFRYVSGKIAAKKPDNVSVKLPTATLGFRGTIVAGQVNDDGGSLAVLLGPGANNNAGAMIGNFVMGNDSGDQEEVNRTGFGVEAGADGNISGVFQASESQINGLTYGLLPGGGGGDEGGTGGSDGTEGGGDNLLGGDSATGVSGEGIISTEEASNDANFSADLSNANDDASTQAAQDALDQAGEAIVIADETAATLGAITTAEEMQQVTGVTDPYHFDEQNVSTSDPNISYLIMTDISFTEGSQSVGGGYSRVEVNNNGTDLFFNLDVPQDFSSGSNPFSFTDIPEANGNYYKLDACLTVKNIEGGTVGSIDSTAVAAEHSVTLYSTVSMPVEIATGSGEAPRVDGATPEAMA